MGGGGGTMKERKELCEKIEELQTPVNNLKVAKCALEKNGVL